jgi:hypothetical protein
MAMSGREEAGGSLRLDSLRSIPVFPRAQANLRAGGESVVFFGNTLGVECQRCGAYNQTSMGHKYCAHVSCPIALREFKRRKRKRTSSLEKVYLPRTMAKRMAGVEGLPPDETEA